MNVLEMGDRFWERLKERSPKLGASDLSFDQSHTHHALVCVLVFGGFGMLTALLVIGPGRYVFGIPLALGILVGFLFYAIREVVARIPNWRYRRWDGLLDVLVPVTWLGPWAFAAIARGVPWWTGALLYVAAALIAFAYTFGRPHGAFLYSAGVY